MSDRAYIEIGRLTDGTQVFRLVCPRCEPQRIGAWLSNLTTAERHRSLHERTVHAEKAIA